MNVPLELSFRDGTKSDDIEALVREKVANLERFNDHISSCRVAVERPQEHVDSGSGYRVRVDLTVPPGHELVARREPGQGNVQDDLAMVIRETFGEAERQLKRLNEQQHGEEKTHPQQQTVGVVEQLFEDHGFLKNLDGRDVYFHRNAVLHDDFDRLTVGTGVNYMEEMGEEGLQASTVRIVDKPGAREGAE
jgi:cold shock CspA family protein/ribosome-associated translation inhibitor RaiA